MGKGGMGMVGANFSEGVKKHHNPKWDKDNTEKPERGAPGGPNAAEHIRKKVKERESGSVDWASRFAEDTRFG